MLRNTLWYSKLLTESRINRMFGMSRVTSKGSAPELDERETDTRVMCTVDALKHSDFICHNYGLNGWMTWKLLPMRDPTLDNGGLTLGHHVISMMIRVWLTLSKQQKMERCNLWATLQLLIAREKKCDVEIHMWKELKWTNTLYVPEIRRNLVSGWLLNKFGFLFILIK